jgi:hypothetical protein
MSTENLPVLWEQIVALDELYGLHFAHQSRLTRDPEILDHLIAQAEHVLSALETAQGQKPDIQKAIDHAEKQCALFCKERLAVLETLAKNPNSLREVALLHMYSQAVVNRYYRHFAGMSRATRDLSILREMISDLENFQGEALALQTKGENAATETLQYINHHLQFFNNEVKAIETARAQGDAQQRAGVLGACANTLLGWYFRNIADKSKLTRRPERLRRMSQELENLLHDMQLLADAGLQWPKLAENMHIVEQSLERWKDELAQIRSLREQTSVNDLLEALAQETEKILNEYNDLIGHREGSDVELNTIKQLCDEADEITRQAYNLCLLAKDDLTKTQYQRSHSTTRDILTMLMREFERIAKAHMERTLQ